MDENIISLIAKELNISISQVKNTLELLEEGATVLLLHVIVKSVQKVWMKNKFVLFKKIMRIK